ncbi:ribosome maturation factor RimM [Philodulcilactobacillus myokoensis]|uniref:Ribosome maturation factor RimM n=1 Tax=Philodulcilactobacillus myokoensis TaxID=2929573 RepID=A0A9W6B1J3_9LACO|nr:ribosome maturation factor RimM [Philodulcilactobacillus myokoensis]GLB46831.1 ribosome maturation factor RimM [Philodulcilactobacillus myokoensis]
MKYYTIGKIINTHGIKGEVKVASITDFPDQRFKIGNDVYINHNHVDKKLTIDGVRMHQQFILLHFKNYDSINDVELFKQDSLKISEDQLSDQDLKPGEYYYHQIIGLNVVDNDNHHIGVINDIMSTGANDVWVVKRKNKPELLLPKIPQVIKKVDLDNHKVIVVLMKGMD